MPQEPGPVSSPGTASRPQQACSLLPHALPPPVTPGLREAPCESTLFLWPLTQEESRLWLAGEGHPPKHGLPATRDNISPSPIKCFPRGKRISLSDSKAESIGGKGRKSRTEERQQQRIKGRKASSYQEGPPTPKVQFQDRPQGVATARGFEREGLEPQNPVKHPTPQNPP